MTLEEFKNISENIILKYIDEILTSDTIGCLIFRKNRIHKVYIYYERKRLSIHSQCMQNPTELIDRHKIGSIMLYSILRANIFKVDYLKKEIPDYLYFANEHLAFYVALNIVEMFKREEIDYEFHENYTLFFPKTYHVSKDHDNPTFLYNTCLGLSLIKNLKYFDIFAYSTILFQLEKYTDQVLIQDKNKEQE